MNKKHVWIGIAVLLCFLMSVSVVSAETICEGDITAQDIVSGSWDYYDVATNIRNTASVFYIKYDCGKRPEEMSFNAYDVVAYKETAVRWFFDSGSPSADIIPDSVTSTDSIIKYGTSDVVGTVTTTIQKVGSCDGTPNCVLGQVNMFFNVTITNTSTLPASGIQALRFQVAGVGMQPDTYYHIFYGQDYTTAENAMYAQQGFFVCLVRDGVGNMFGLPGPKANLSGYGCLHVDYWSLSSYYNFKNYYEVNTNPTNITVDVQRVGEDLSLYEVKSKLRCYNQYGLILTESAWHTTNQTYTLPVVPQYMYLVPDFGDKSTELYICSYQGTDTAKIYGTIYNAENESTITGAKVEIDAHHSTYSDDSGFYMIHTNHGTNHILTVSKDGYWNWQETIYFPYAGDYNIDIPLIPKPPSHTGHGILGTVRTLPYYQHVENQLVSIENATWSNTTNTNNVGYYIFDDLEVGNYWINVSKDAYRDNNQTVTVSATGDEITTIDNCDATTNWSSDNSLTLNTTDKQEGTGSLQANGSSVMDFNKSTPSVVDASNVTKENGYMTFWYKVNNTSRITDYLIFTVGSNGDNSTDKISWGVYKTYFSNDTWTEIWLKFSDGTETGTLNMSNISWIEVKTAKSSSIISKIDNIRFYDFSYEIHDVDLDPILSLGIIAKELDETIITSFIATLDNSSKNTTTGQELVFSDLNYGMKELTVTSEGYSPYQRSVYLDSNTNITAYMRKDTEGGAGVYYPPPHLVEFRVQTWQGVPFADVTVTATGYSTTMGTWDWLYSIFGYKNETQIHNVTMTDTTDSNGAISFLMVPTIKYEMTFTKGTEVNETLYIAPGVRFYKIIIGTKWVETLSQWDVVNYSILASELNDTHAYINFSYVDANNKTTSLDYFINLINLTSSSNIYNHSYDISNSSNITNSYIVKRGEAYLIGFEADNDDYGEIKYIITGRISEKDKRLLEFEGVPDYIYTYISIGLLCLVGAFFGMITVPEGGIVICLEAWILHFLGWFLWNNPLAPLYLTTATIFAILIIYAAKGRGKGVS